MFVLLQDEVHLQKRGPQGQEQILSTIKPVIMFNEVPVLDGGLNVTTAITQPACVLWRISYEAFHTLL